MANPNIFAGSIISSGTTYANARLLSTLLGNSIRNYYGEDDEPGLSNQTLITQATWNAADAVAIRTKKTNSTIYSTRVLETIGPIPDADHLTMTDRPWDEDVMTDGYGGALAWLLTQTRPEGGKALGLGGKGFWSPVLERCSATTQKIWMLSLNLRLLCFTQPS